MILKSLLSPATRNNWLIDTVIFMGATVASLSGIYFLFLPVGGYQGGRNPMYGVTILFERSTWEDVHTWSGILMITAALIHIAFHWQWITSMAGRIIRDLLERGAHLNHYSRFNVAINATIGLSFILTALTGVYLLFFPGGAHGVPDPIWIFSRSTWDLIHTWSGITLILTAIVHFSIHWKWVTKVTRKLIFSNATSA